MKTIFWMLISFFLTTQLVFAWSQNGALEVGFPATYTQFDSYSKCSDPCYTLSSTCKETLIKNYPLTDKRKNTAFEADKQCHAWVNVCLNGCTTQFSTSPALKR